MYKSIYEKQQTRGFLWNLLFCSFVSFGIDEENRDTYIFKDIQLVCA
jgi:hypothetical protein